MNASPFFLCLLESRLPQPDPLPCWEDFRRWMFSGHSLTGCVIVIAPGYRRLVATSFAIGCEPASECFDGFETNFDSDFDTNFNLRTHRIESRRNDITARVVVYHSERSAIISGLNFSDMLACASISDGHYGEHERYAPRSNSTRHAANCPSSSPGRRASLVSIRRFEHSLAQEGRLAA